MHPNKFAHRSHDSQVTIRNAAREIAQEFGSHPMVPQIPAVPKNARGHSRDVAHLKQNEAIASLLAFAALVFQDLRGQALTDSVNAIGDQLMREDTEKITDEVNDEAVIEEIGVTEIPDHFREFVVVEAFEQDGTAFEVGAAIKIDPAQFADWIELGLIIPIEKSADPNPETPEGDTPQAPPAPVEGADPNPETPEPTSNGGIGIEDLTPITETPAEAEAPPAPEPAKPDPVPEKAHKKNK